MHGIAGFVPGRSGSDAIAYAGRGQWSFSTVDPDGGEIMQHSRYSMRGAGAVTILALIFLALLIGTFVIKMGTQYTQYLTVRSVMEDVASQPGAADKSKAELWRELNRRFQINSVYDGIESDDFTIREEGDSRHLDLYYEVRREFLGNIDVVARFSRSETLAP